MRTTGNGFFFIVPVRVRVEVISYTCRLLIFKSVASSCTVKISIIVTLVTPRPLNLYPPPARMLRYVFSKRGTVLGSPPLPSSAGQFRTGPGMVNQLD